MNNSKVRDRKFCAVLYPDDPTHCDAMEKLKTEGYNFAAILHDRDLYEDGDQKGELKKPHWHVVVKFPNAVWITSLSKDLGIGSNYFEPAKNLDAALLYLVHDGYEEKYQYELNDVFGSLKTRLATLLRDDDEGTRALTIFQLIADAPGYVTYTEIFTKACKSGLYSDFRRMGSGVAWLIREHNQEFFEVSQNNAGVSESAARFRDYLEWTSGKTDDVLDIPGCRPFNGGKKHEN